MEARSNSRFFCNNYLTVAYNQNIPAKNPGIPFDEPKQLFSRITQTDYTSSRPFGKANQQRQLYRILSYTTGQIPIRKSRDQHSRF